MGLGRSEKVFGVRNVCEICHTPYNHSHSCKYYCQLCLQHDHALNTAMRRRCPSCRLLRGPGEPKLYGSDFMWKSSSKVEAGSAVCARNRPVTQASSSAPCLGSNPTSRAGLSSWDGTWGKPCMAQIVFLPWRECQMPHGMKECHGKLKENGSFRGHVDLSQLLNDTSFRAMLL